MSEAGDRSEDEETVHYSMSEGEGDFPAPTPLPHSTGEHAGRRREQKEGEGEKRRAPVQGSEVATLLFDHHLQPEMAALVAAVG